MNVKANLHHFRLSNSGLISLSINYSAFPEPPSEPGAAEWYQFHFPACSLANTVAEIGEFSHFAFQFKGKFLLSISCINSMLLSKTFIGLARTIKSRYSFQWQYLELICSHFELRQPVAIWDVGLVKRIGSIHHWHLQRSRTVPGDPWAQELQGWAGRAEMNPGQSPRQGLSHGIFTHMEQAAGLRLQGSSSHRFMSHLHSLAHLHQPWHCREPRALRAQLCARHGRRALRSAGLQCISWPAMQNLHFSLTFLGKKINISLNQMLFSTKLKELVMVVLFC